MQEKKMMWDFLADSVLEKILLGFPAGNLFLQKDPARQLLLNEEKLYHS